MIYSHVETSFHPQNKSPKAESEQAPPTEPKAEELPAAVPSAPGLDLGLDTRAEEPVEGAAVSITSILPSTRLPCPSHAHLMIPFLPSPSRFTGTQSPPYLSCLPRSCGLYSFGSESSFFNFFKKEDTERPDLTLSYSHRLGSQKRVP